MTALDALLAVREDVQQELREAGVGSVLSLELPTDELVSLLIAFELGVSNGARSALDSAEFISAEKEASPCGCGESYGTKADARINENAGLEGLEEADAIYLDSIAAQVQNIAERIEFIEAEIGFKYTG